jgi:hypothetical protein
VNGLSLAGLKEIKRRKDKDFLGKTAHYHVNVIFTKFLFVCLVGWFFEIVLLCRPGWPQTHGSPVSVSPVLGLQ